MIRAERLDTPRELTDDEIDAPTAALRVAEAELRVTAGRATSLDAAGRCSADAELGVARAIGERP